MLESKALAAQACKQTAIDILHNLLYWLGSAVLRPQHLTVPLILASARLQLVLAQPVHGRPQMELELKMKLELEP